MNDNRLIKRLLPVSILSTKGFTLVELIVVMAIFMGVIIISSEAFNKILSMSMQQSKSAESDTQGVIGLEMLRVDLEHSGYGLPWLLSFPAAFEESQEVANHNAPGIDPKTFNDINNTTSDTNKVPRAVQAASGSDGRDYLVIKSVLAGMEDVNKKWTYVQNTGVDSRLKIWGTNDFKSSAPDEKVITIDSRTKRLVAASTPANGLSTYDSANQADYSYIATSGMLITDATFQQKQDTDAFVVYGVSNSAVLRAPYNRVDYYVKRPASDSDIAARCAKGTNGKPGTGILYKAIMNQADGKFPAEYPLMDCIADMQVAFNLDTNGDGSADTLTTENGLLLLSAKEIRQQLKEIIVYLVAHEGGRDTGFKYANETIIVGEGNGRSLNLKNDVVGSDEYKYYRWKTYKLVVIPRNINY